MANRQEKTVRSVFNGAPIRVNNASRTATTVRTANDARRMQAASTTGQTQGVRTTRQTQNPLNPSENRQASVNARAVVNAKSSGAASTNSLNNNAVSGLKNSSSGVKTEQVNATKKKQGTNGTKNNKNVKMIACIIAAVLVCVGIGVGVAFALRDNGQQASSEGEGDENVASDIPEENTEEMQRVTDETIKKYAEVNVEGYQEVNDDSFTGNAVVVTVKNNSEEKVSLAIQIGAYDAEEHLLDTSSVYAEGIEPGQTHKFNTFVFSDLSPEQLRTAIYKVYRASTYEAPSSTQGETVTTEEITENASGGEEVQQSVEEGV